MTAFQFKGRISADEYGAGFGVNGMVEAETAFEALQQLGAELQLVHPNEESGAIPLHPDAQPDGEAFLATLRRCRSLSLTITPLPILSAETLAGKLEQSVKTERKLEIVP
jgi:hypothetical protein